MVREHAHRLLTYRVFPRPTHRPQRVGDNKQFVVCKRREYAYTAQEGPVKVALLMGCERKKCICIRAIELCKAAIHYAVFTFCNIAPIMTCLNVIRSSAQHVICKTTHSMGGTKCNVSSMFTDKIQLLHSYVVSVSSVATQRYYVLTVSTAVTVAARGASYSSASSPNPLPLPARITTPRPSMLISAAPAVTT